MIIKIKLVMITVIVVNLAIKQVEENFRMIQKEMKLKKIIIYLGKQKKIKGRKAKLKI